MRGFNRIATGILLCMGAAASLASAAVDKITAPTVINNEKRKAAHRSTAQPGSSCHAKKRGPGWSQPHVKRMARKRRNQARNKLHHRRRKA